jgi:hypothetical protein
MAKHISLLLISMFFYSTLSSAEGFNPPKKKKKTDDEPVYTNVITTYPFSLFSSNMKFGFEHMYSDNKSICVILNYGSAEESQAYESGYFTEVGIEIQPRFYRNNENSNPDGIYVSPMVRYKFINYKPFAHYAPSPNETTASTFNIGYSIGYQRIFDSGFCFNVYGGASINAPSGDYRYISDPFNGYKKGVNPYLGASLGLAF